MTPDAEATGPAIRAPDPGARWGWRVALDVLGTGLAEADPGRAVRRHVSVEDETVAFGEATIDLSRIDRVYLVGAGKAATGMVQAVEGLLGERCAGGVAVTIRGAAPSVSATHVYAAGHPLPDPGGLIATRHIARLLETASADDLVVFVLSGGASALLELPAGRIPLADLQAATGALLSCGAPIPEVNAVRKHISAVKGGGLARLAAPARLVTLVLSDVVGSPLDVIGSGPTVPDPTTYADAGSVFSRYDLWSRVPSTVANHIRAGMAGHLAETAKPGDPVFDRATALVVGDNRASAEACLRRGRDLGLDAVLLTTFLEGEAREVGRALAAIAKECAASGRPVGAPGLVVCGGETTVTLRRLGGYGGRNQEMALSAALALAGWDGVTVAALATDGVDGTTDAAGAVVDGTTASRSRALRLDPEESLDRHDSGTLFRALDQRLVTGPTGTNVNDLVCIVVEP